MRPAPHWPALVAGAVGAIFFTWIATPRVIDPTEVNWVMQGDWQWHFLGWHFFRSEAWTWPPGAITSYVEPIGSALGYTDSIPLAAFLLKPFASLLPNPFQYLGLWFLVCFTLQGSLGALVVGTWTRSPWLAIAGGSLLVFLPTLLARMAHPALSSHWLLLWALWLTWRRPPSADAPPGRRLTTITHAPNRSDIAQHAALGLISGLVHPYLAVMVLALLLPLAVVRVMGLADLPVTMNEGSTRTRSRFAGAVPFFTAAAGVFAGWWAAGLFTVTSSGDLQGQYLGNYGMNLLGPLTPVGRSVFLPDLPVQSVDQTGEGYHYFGAGVLGLTVIAAALLIRARRRFSPASVPLLLVLSGCAVYALSPRVTLGGGVLVDVVDWFDDATIFMVFRASARFFWPVTYAVVAGSIGVVAATLKPRLAVTVVAGALLLQVADLHKWYSNVNLGARGEAFYVWNTPLRSPEWRTLFSRAPAPDGGARTYAHIRMYSPELCRGPIPVPFAPVAYLAGIYGLGINDGFAARMDTARLARECARLRDEFAKGIVDDATIYLIAGPLLAEFEQRTGGAVSCRDIDGVTVCVTRRSLEGTTSVPPATSVPGDAGGGRRSEEGRRS